MNALFYRNQIISRERLIDITGLNFTQNEYMHLHRAANFARKKFSAKPGSNGTSMTLESYMHRVKKGSGKYRRIIGRTEKGNGIETMRVVNTFFDLFTCQKPSEKAIEGLHSLWNFNCLTNRVRCFAFQFFNNSVAVGARIAARYRHTGQLIDQRCAFCLKSGSDNPGREDFRHLFLDCPTLKPVVNRYFQKYFAMAFDTADEKIRLLKMTGIVENSSKTKEFFLMLHMLLLNFVVWEYKLKRLIPSMASLETEIDSLFYGILASQKFRDLALTCDTTLCRRWREQHHGRG